MSVKNERESRGFNYLQMPTQLYVLLLMLYSLVLIVLKLYYYRNSIEIDLLQISVELKDKQLSHSFPRLHRLTRCE